MRSVMGLAGLFVLASCDRTGVEIIVYPPADTSVQVDQVRLYLGVGDGTSETITPADPGTPRANARDGMYWTRDASNELDVQALTPGSGTPARFVFSGDEGQELTAIAVGFLGGAPNSSIAQFDITIPAEHVEVFRIGLNPARDPASASFANNQVQLWGPETVSGAEDHSCVRAENYRTDVADGYHRVAYIVSDGDPDCDGYPSQSPEECQEFVYRGKKLVTQRSLACLTTADLPSSVGGAACVLGGEVCEDGKPDTRIDCSTSRPFCAPQSLCDECGDDFECAIDPLQHNLDTQTHVRCAIHATALADDNVALCSHEIIRVLPPLSLDNGDQCTGSPMFRGSGSGPASGHGLGRWAGEWVTDMGSLTFGALDPSCAFAINVAGIVPASVFPLGGLVSLEITSSRGDHGLIVPVEVELVPGECAEEVICQPVNLSVTETIGACLQSIVPGI